MGGAKRGLVFLCVVAVLLCLFFYRSFSPDLVLFSNDCPMGLLAAFSKQLLSDFLGNWNSLNWIGGALPAASPNISQLIYILIGPPIWGDQGVVFFTKFYVPICMIILAGSAWFLSRRMGFGFGVSALLAIAAMMNSNSFSNACWGLPTWTLAHALFYFAIAFLYRLNNQASFINLCLAGCATGIAVMEGFDTGAILSVLVGVFCCFYGLDQFR